MADNPSCHRCAVDKEDVIHMARDCVSSREIWECLPISNMSPDFYNMPLRDWLLFGLRHGRERNKTASSPERMAISLWWIWRWRNDEVFGSGTTPLSHRLEIITRSFDENRVVWEEEALPQVLSDPCNGLPHPDPDQGVT